MTRDEYEEWLDSVRFKENAISEEFSSKRKVVDLYIEQYRNCKEDYLAREEEPNMMGYFSRSEQSLRGVFI
jgi:hypothetical protein